MQLTETQLCTYVDKDFLLLPESFLQAEVDRIKAELPAMIARSSRYGVVIIEFGLFYEESQLQ
jgi:hypothetical protein